MDTASLNTFYLIVRATGERVKTFMRSKASTAGVSNDVGQTFETEHGDIVTNSELGWGIHRDGKILIADKE